MVQGVTTKTLKDWQRIKTLRQELRKLDSLSEKERTSLSDSEKKRFLEMKFLERKLTYKYDFYAFIIELLDAENRGEDPQPLAKVHKRLCRFLRRTRNLRENTLIMLPRNHLKTQITTIYYRTWILLNDPNYVALIVSGTLELSKGTAREIKRELEDNEKLKEFYPEVLDESVFDPRRNKWSETQFSVKRSKNRKESTIEAVGIEATVAGKHFPEVSFDDVVTSENSATPEGCEKLIKQFTYFKSVVDPNVGIIRLTGTFYNDSDLYNYLLEIKDEINFQTFIEPIPPTLEPLWPGKFTKESLKQIEILQGPYVFATQYLLDPVPESQMEFKKEWLIRYSAIPQDIDGKEIQLNKFLIVDPITAKKTSSTSKDRGVILAVGIDAKSQDIYILEYKLYDRATDSELFEGVFELCEEHGTYTVGWESVAHQNNTRINLAEEARRRGILNFKAVELRPGNKDKNTRIRGMIPFFARGQVHIRPTMQELITEYCRFPHGKTKDIIDCLAYIPTMLQRKRTLNKTLNSQIINRKNREKSFNPLNRKAFYV